MTRAKVLGQETARVVRRQKHTQGSQGQPVVCPDLGFYSVCAGSPWRALISTGQWCELKERTERARFTSTGFILFHMFSTRYFTSFL